MDISSPALFNIDFSSLHFKLPFTSSHFPPSSIHLTDIRQRIPVHISRPLKRRFRILKG
jgi:hypothetical protein